MNRTELLIHPLRLRILQHLSVYKEATTNEIISALPEVSKASVYQERDPSEDMLFAGRDYLLLTDEEFKQFTDEYEKLCTKYMEKKSINAKPRNISIISSPVFEEGMLK